MNRREFLLSSGAAAGAVMAGVTPGWAWNLKHSPESVYDNLARALWASTNRQGQRAAYVIAAPWCAVTRAFYDMVRQQSPDCDFRFVWQNDRNEHQTKIMYSTYFHEGNNQLVAYENDVSQADGVTQGQLDLASGINEAMVSSIGTHIRPFLAGGGGSTSSFGWGYPTVIFKSHGVVKAVTGLPSDLNGLVASIDGGIERPAPTPGLLSVVREPLQLWKTTEGYRYAQQDNVVLYSAPMTDAPIIEELERGRGYPAYTEADYEGHRWLGLNAFGQPWPILWGKLEQF